MACNKTIKTDYCIVLYCSCHTNNIYLHKFKYGIAIQTELYTYIPSPLNPIWISPSSDRQINDNFTH